MSLILDKFLESKRQFDMERGREDGSMVMGKIIEIINDLGQNWNIYNGGELAERQMKLAGYEFYMADYIADLNRISEQLKLEMKEVRAKRWDEISELIRAEKGKVQNKDQIENILVIETKEIATQQILYETLFFKYKLKLAALKDIITALVQQISAKKNEVELSRNTQ
jgi:hypothetical protein